MADKISLRDYQRDLVERLRSTEGGRIASKLGVQAGSESWLVDLSDAGEVVPVPAISPVPLTRSWFKGLASIRGNLYSVVDFPAFLGGAAVTVGDQARLLLIGSRFRMGSALLVDQSLGLRNPERLKLRTGAPAPGAPWLRAEYDDVDGRVWKELDMAQLVRHPDFLVVAS
jgi:twitching motility protein PilI